MDLNWGQVWCNIQAALPFPFNNHAPVERRALQNADLFHKQHNNLYSGSSHYPNSTMQYSKGLSASIHQSQNLLVGVYGF